MKVSQLIHKMDRDDEIVIDDYDAPVFQNRIYAGAARGIKKDDPVNQMLIQSICAGGDVILVLARQKGADHEPRKTDRRYRQK